MKNQMVYTCTVMIFVLLLLKFEIISGSRQYKVNDDTIDYDDKHLHFKHIRSSKQNRRLLLPRNFFTHRQKDRDLQESKQREGERLITKDNPDCLKCYQFGYEPECGTDGKDYENSCYRKCTGFPVVNGVSLGDFFPDLPGSPSPGLLSMGKCKKCNCKQILEAECGKAVGADKICIRFCNDEEKHHHHIDCTGNGPCICPKKSRKVNLIEWDQQCGSDGKMYEDACRRECAGVAEILPDICKACKCTLIWQTLKCGGKWGQKFSQKCIEKCQKELAEIEKTNYVGCEKSTNFICKCPIDAETLHGPVCGDDYVTYPNLCALKCAGRKLVSQYACRLG